MIKKSFNQNHSFTKTTVICLKFFCRNLYKIESSFQKITNWMQHAAVHPDVSTIHRFKAANNGTCPGLPTTENYKLHGWWVSGLPLSETSGTRLLLSF